MTTAIDARSPALLDFGTTATLKGGGWVTGGSVSLVAIASSLAWGFGYFGQPHILARFMGIRSAGHVPVARRIGTTWVFCSLCGAALVGLAGIALFQTPLNNPETVFLDLIDATVNPWIGGFLLAAVLAAIMSTADSQLLVASTSITEDVYRAVFRADAPQSTLLWVGRATTLAVMVVAYLLALQGGTVLDIVAYAWAGFGATFGPMIVLSLYWPRMTASGAMAGMLSGAATVLAWESLALEATTEVYSMIPGVAISTACVVAFSLLSAAPTGQGWSGAHAGRVESADRG